MLIYGCKGKETKSYRVQSKDSANFSIFISMLYPNEKILVKINDEIVLNQIGDKKKGSPQSYLYYKYPSKIKKISISGSHKGDVTFERLYIDTLLNVAQKSLILSYPSLKHMKEDNFKPYGFIRVKDAKRNIMLVDDAVHYKDTWRY